MAVPPVSGGVLVAMSATAIFDEANLDKIDVFSSSLLSESGDVLDTNLNHLGNQVSGLGDQIAERDVVVQNKGLEERAMQSLKNAACFATYPLPHLTKTIAISFEGQAKEVAVGVNFATTHYKHVGSLNCWDDDTGGPLCFAGALAISPPWDLPPNPAGT